MEKEVMRTSHNVQSGNLLDVLHSIFSNEDQESWSPTAHLNVLITSFFHIWFGDELDTFQERFIY